jgi:hypothetical protein
VTILQGLGIRATPALVNTFSQRAVGDMLPTPVAFNHVLVRVELPSRSLWMDPTQWFQGGTAASLIEPNYGVALMLSEDTNALTTMTPSATVARRSARSIDASLDLRKGFESPARYSIATTYEGMAADSVRSSLRSISRDELQKQYQTFYGQYFPNITWVGSLSIEDDLQLNRVVTTETYDIPAFWTLSEARKRREGVVRVPEIESLLRSPRTTVRTSPLAYSNPLELQQTTQILLPDKWSVVPETHQISGSAFDFTRSVESGPGNTLLLRDSFTSKTDEIVPAAMAQYTANLSKARESVDFVLTRRGVGHDGGSTFLDRVNWLVATLALGFVAVWVWLALRIYRVDREPGAGPTDAALSGLGGWLILMGIGMCVGPIVRARCVVKSHGSHGGGLQPVMGALASRRACRQSGHVGDAAPGRGAVFQAPLKFSCRVHVLRHRCDGVPIG